MFLRSILFLLMQVTEEKNHHSHDALIQGGGWKKIARAEKNCVPPPSTLQGLPAQKLLSHHNSIIWKIFYPGPILGPEMGIFAPSFSLHIACTELFEPIDHFKLVLLVEVICEGAFFFLLGTNVGTRMESFASN